MTDRPEPPEDSLPEGVESVSEEQAPSGSPPAPHRGPWPDTPRSPAPSGLLDPDEYGTVPLTRPDPIDPEVGGELISLSGHRVAPADPSDDTIVDADDDTLAPPPEHLLRPALEAMMLAADGPVSTNVLNGWLGEPGERAVRDTLREIAADLLREQRGWRLVEVAKGWQLRTDVRFGRWVARMRGGRPQRLSNAAMDVLAVVAYRQPCTRTEVDQLRGVDSGGVLRLLCERGLTAVMGRKEVPGRPLLYGTTKNFLSLFGLRDLSDLPTLRDLRELRRDDERLPPGAAELLGISAEQLGRALGLEEDDSEPPDHEGVQTHLFEVLDDHDDEEEDEDLD